MTKPPSCLFLDQGREFIILSNGCLDPFANLLFGNMVLVRNVQMCSIASQLNVVNSQAYKNMEMTREHISFTFDPIDMLFSLQIGFSFIRAAVVWAILERI